MIKCWASQPPAQLAEEPTVNPADTRTDSQPAEREEAQKQQQLQRLK